MLPSQIIRIAINYEHCCVIIRLFFLEKKDEEKNNKLFSVLALTGLLADSLALASNAQASGSSIQAMGSWYDAGDSGDTYGFGIRGTAEVMEALGIDLGYTYFGAGDDVDIGVMYRF